MNSILKKIIFLEIIKDQKTIVIRDKEEIKKIYKTLTKNDSTRISFGKVIDLRKDSSRINIESELIVINFYTGKRKNPRIQISFTINDDDFIRNNCTNLKEKQAGVYFQIEKIINKSKLTTCPSV